MIKQYIKTAWRNLIKNKIYSGIHLFGLVLGITTCLLLAAYVIGEFRYDRFHRDGANIYRVNTDLVLPEQHLKLSVSSGAVGPNLKNDFPAVKNFTRIVRSPVSLPFQKNDLSFFEKNVVYADTSFFNMFDFELLAGDRRSVLRGTDEIVLTHSLAKKYFGDQDPLGSTLSIDKQLYTVTGVVADPPENSHLSFDALISLATWVKKFPYTETNWGWNPVTTYIALETKSDYGKLSAMLDTWIKKKTPAEQGSETKLSLVPFRQIHFSETRLGDFKPNSSKTQVLLLALTGIFILFLALFNYLNLATAIYTSRTKEIGIRKTFGANRGQIASQFLMESILLCGIAVSLALILANVLLPIFSAQIKQNLAVNFFSPVFVIAAALITLLIIAPSAGFYPSFILSRLKINSMFKNDAGMGLGKTSLRRVLTSLQFTISIGLIICTIIIWNQHRFLASQSMGFQQANKLVIQMGNTADAPRFSRAVKQALLNLPGVQGVAFSSHIPAEHLHGVGTSVKRKDGTEANSEMELNLVDFDFIDLYQLKIIAGRKFMPSFAQDTVGALILNETAVKQLGFSNPGEIIGRDFNQWGRKGQVIGVIKDFNQHALQAGIGPVSLQVNSSLFEKITIAYKTTDVSQLIKRIQRTWKQETGNMPFDYLFLDDWLASQYDAERRFSNIFIAFSVLAIFIACIGLYGLTAVAIKKRIKEIGIRKVLGASVPGIIRLLFHEIFFLLIVSILIASPLAWYIMYNWLEDFAYRINIGWWVFGIAGGAALLVALLSVSFQAIKAAITNPVKSLRTE